MRSEYLNLFSAMLDRSELSKTASIIFLFFISSCGLLSTKHGEIKNKREEIIYSHTVLDCPNGRKITLRYNNASEVKKAIAEAIRKKKNEKTGDNFTALRFGSHHRSARINNMPPEETARCSVYQIPLTPAEKRKAHFYFR